MRVWGFNWNKYRVDTINRGSLFDRAARPVSELEQLICPLILLAYQAIVFLFHYYRNQYLIHLSFHPSFWSFLPPSTQAHNQSRAPCKPQSHHTSHLARVTFSTGSQFNSLSGQGRVVRESLGFLLLRALILPQHLAWVWRDDYIIRRELHVH